MTRAAQRGDQVWPGAGRAAGRWTVAPDRSRARFQVRDKLVATVHGSLPVDAGVLTLDGSAVTEGRVSLRVAGIDTGNARRDRDLTKPRLLDAASFPTVEVEVEPTADIAEGLTARAVLHARGRTAPLDVTVRVVESPEDTDSSSTGTRESRLRLRVSGRLDRRPLDIRVPSFVIGRFVDVEADLVFVRPPATDPVE